MLMLGVGFRIRGGHGNGDSGDRKSVGGVKATLVKHRASGETGEGNGQLKCAWHAWELPKLKDHMRSGRKGHSRSSTDSQAYQRSL